MKNTKLIQLFSKLDRSEIKDFGNYLVWKAFKPTGGVFLLYKYLKKYHPDFPDNKVTKETLNKAIFKNSKSSSRIYDVMSLLNNALENYLITKEIENDSTKRDLFFLDVLQDRKYDSMFFQKVDQIKNEFIDDKKYGLENLYHIYNLNLMHHSHPNYLATKEKELDFMDVSKSLDDFFIASKLHHYCVFEIESHANTQSDNKTIIKLSLKEAILKTGQNDRYNAVPHINLLYKLNSAFISSSFEEIQALKEQYFNKFHHFNASEMYDIHSTIMVLFYKYYLDGIKDALVEILEMYKFGLENNLLYEFGYLNEILFTNIVNTSCAVGNLKWTDKFIAEYNQFLPEQERRDCVLYCNSQVAFERNEFDTVLKNLSTVKFKNPNLILATKVLLLQCYYELEDFQDLFENLARALATYLKRNNTMTEEMKIPHNNFIQIIKKLYKIKFSINPSKLIDQLKKMPELNNVVKKQWLEKKIISINKSNTHLN